VAMLRASVAAVRTRAARASATSSNATSTSTRVKPRQRSAITGSELAQPQVSIQAAAEFPTGIAAGGVDAQPERGHLPGAKACQLGRRRGVLGKLQRLALALQFQLH